MIALDTSALIAIALREPGWEPCFKVVNSGADLIISAANVAEALIVALGRGVDATFPTFLHSLSATVIPVDEATSRRVADIYRRWGKGVHPARLNFCDCFAYDVAQQHACPLLFIGNDFAQTDIASAL